MPPKYKPKSKRPRKPVARPANGASASIKGRYRYSLSRWREPFAPHYLPGTRVAWVMLNPSTADALEDDPTIRRVRGFSERGGHTFVEVVNLFAYRATKPAHLFERKVDIVGPLNDAYITQALARADRVVFAWGAAQNPKIEARAEWLRSYCISHGISPWCLGETSSGAPGHPLYKRSDTPLVRWSGVPTTVPQSYPESPGLGGH